MKKQRIVIWRHGQTDWNIENRFQGHSDISLNSVGVSQAKRSAAILAEMVPTKIISSDLDRAFKTATELAKIVNLEIIKDQDLSMIQKLLPNRRIQTIIKNQVMIEVICVLLPTCDFQKALMKKRFSPPIFLHKNIILMVEFGNF